MTVDLMEGIEKPETERCVCCNSRLMSEEERFRQVCYRCWQNGEEEAVAQATHEYAELLRSN